VRETITQALTDETIDRNAVKKLVITGEIEGTDYSDESEWSMFRFLDTTFPNIEEVELLTSQDLLDADQVLRRSLFYRNGVSGAKWLKRFSAPNTKYVGSYNFAVCENLEEIYFPLVERTAVLSFGHCNSLKYVELPNVIHLEDFYNCENLVSVYAPKVETLGSMAFYRCYSLLEVDFPLVTIIPGMAFNICSNLVSVNFPKVTKVGYNTYWEMFASDAFTSTPSLTSVSFGTAFEEPTEIEFGSVAFGNYYSTLDQCHIEGCEENGTQHWHFTDSIELTLGEYVLPKSEENAWNFLKHFDFSKPILDSLIIIGPYIWKIIHTVGIKELIKDVLVEVYPNPATEYTTLSFSLEKPCYLEIDLYDINGKKVRDIYNNFAIAELFTKRINTDNLAKGIYFIKISIDKDYIIKQIIVN